MKHIRGASLLAAAAIMAASAAAPTWSIHPGTPGPVRNRPHNGPSKASHKQNARRAKKGSKR